MRPLTLWLLLAVPVLADDLVVVTMPTCAPCIRLKRDLLRRPELYRGHSLRLVEGREAMARHSVDSVPTIIRSRDGREVARRVGYARPSDLTDWLAQHGD